MVTKKCSSCCEHLPLFDFHKHPTASHGVKNVCKRCSKAINRKAYDARLKKAGKKRHTFKPTYVLISTAKRGDVRKDGLVFLCKRKVAHGYYEWWMPVEEFERRKAASLERAKWRYHNDSEYREKQRVRNCSPEARKRKARWQKGNRGWIAHWFSERRAAERGSYVQLTEDEKRQVREFYRFRDVLNAVHGKVMFHVDHIVPLARGGTHTPQNLQVTTKEYNEKKFINPDPIRANA